MAISDELATIRTALGNILAGADSLEDKKQAISSIVSGTRGMLDAIKEQVDRARRPDVVVAAEITDAIDRVRTDR